MDALQQVCLVVEMDGFFFKRFRGSKTPPVFLARDMGWCDWTGQHCSSYHYGHSYLYHQLSLRDRRTVQHTWKRITGLPFYPLPDEKARPQSQLKADLQCLYDQQKTPDKTIVAFKGGHRGKDPPARLGHSFF